MRSTARVGDIDHLAGDHGDRHARSSSAPSGPRVVPLAADQPSSQETRESGGATLPTFSEDANSLRRAVRWLRGYRGRLRTAGKLTREAHVVLYAAEIAMGDAADAYALAAEHGRKARHQRDMRGKT